MPAFDPVRDAVLNSPITPHPASPRTRRPSLSALLNDNDSPGPPPRPPSTIPYNPRRITPAGLVLTPLTAQEVARYADFVGQGTARLRKRPRSEVTTPEAGEPPRKRRADDVGIVVDHYNSRPNVGVVQRLDSPIIGLKNFNNWVKAVLFASFAHPALAKSPTGRSRGQAGRALDMGCGKGGDLNKWARARVREVCAVDIARVSVEQARERWELMKPPRFNASFATLDCYVEPLSRAFSPALLGRMFDVVSMQFCMHYAFESVQKARCMLDNVSGYLRAGGVFVGTVPNAEILLGALNDLSPDAEDLSFGNSVYKIRFEERAAQSLFGHKYWFFLQDAVEDVPEYIVHWDNFVQMAAEYKLVPVYKEEFHQVFERHQTHSEFGPLLQRMQVVDAKGAKAMDEDQWEAANIYIAFAFEKQA